MSAPGNSERKILIGSEEEANKPFEKPFYFIQAADSQYGLIDRYVKHLENPGWEEEKRSSEQLVAVCNQMEPKPKFMIICGDMIDAMPGERFRAEQIAAFKETYSTLNIPLVCVCGNHDLGDIPTMEGLEDYKRAFGDDYFYFTLNGVLFITINSSFYENREKVSDYAKEHDEWLLKILSKCKQFKYSIIFEHIPWFLHDPEEDKEYFNIEKTIRLEWLEKFKAAGINKIMCGHYHRNAGGWYGDIELVVTSAIGLQFGPEKSGARVVKILNDKIEHEYYSTEDLPKRVELGN